MRNHEEHPSVEDGGVDAEQEHVSDGPLSVQQAGPMVRLKP